MKKLKLLLFSLFVVATLQAQITEDEKSMSMGVNNALVLELEGTTEKIVEKLWKKNLKQFEGKTKKNKKADEFFSDDAEIVAIGGANTIDLYSRIAESGDNVYLTFWVDMGGSFLNSSEHAAQYTEAEKILLRFAIDVAREMTRLELEDEEDKAKKLEKTLKKLKSDNERYHREIEKAKETIAKNEANIETNDREQIETNEQIELQQEVINEVTNRLNDL